MGYYGNINIANPIPNLYQLDPIARSRPKIQINEVKSIFEFIYMPPEKQTLLVAKRREDDRDKNNCQKTIYLKQILWITPTPGEKIIRYKLIVGNSFKTTKTKTRNHKSKTENPKTKTRKKEPFLSLL